MSKFELTAKSDMNFNGQHLPKGQTVSIDINISGIGPNNLFNNARCADSLRHQLALHDINVSPNSPALLGGKWDVKMTK